MWNLLRLKYGLVVTARDGATLAVPFLVLLALGIVTQIHFVIPLDVVILAPGVTG